MNPFISRVSSVWYDLLEASRQSDRSRLDIIVEAMRLRLAAPHLSWDEYLNFRLFESRHTLDQKREFGGWRTQHVLEEILVDELSKFAVQDKITMYSVMQAFGLPIPKLKAAYATLRPKGLPCRQDPESLAELLALPGFAPVYLKPSFGVRGLGNTLVTAAGRGVLSLGDGRSVDAIEFCRSLETKRALGWLLQEPVQACSEIAQWCGSDKVSGLRLHTFLTPTGPRLVTGVWKINSGREDSDNFRRGLTGNMAAAIDPVSGRVTRTISGMGLHQRVNAPHPSTGHPLIGVQLPFWKEAVAVALDAHLAFPGILCPGWDIALTDSGPVLLEINAFGDLDLPQYAHGIGFLGREFLDCMHVSKLRLLLTERANSSKRSKRNGRLGTRKHHWDW